MKRIVVVGGIVAIVLATVVSFYASSNPDGLEKVAGDHGILSTTQDTATAGSPLADYSARGVSDERLSAGLAGLVGVAVTGAVAFGLFYAVRRRS